MAKEPPKLKLGKGAAFVKTHLKRLEQENDTWEADFRALPKPQGQTETHYLGLVVALPHATPLVCIPVEYTPDVNDLADLLAAAMRRPMTDSAHRPSPRWTTNAGSNSWWSILTAPMPCPLCRGAKPAGPTE